MRIFEHPVLGGEREPEWVIIYVDGKAVWSRPGEPIAAAILGSGRRHLRYSPRRQEPRGVFCAVGRCNECMMVVDGEPNVRTCVTPVRSGMVVRTQGKGKPHE